MDAFQQHATGIAADMVRLELVPKDRQILLAAQLEHAMRAAWHAGFHDLALAADSLRVEHPEDASPLHARMRELAGLARFSSRPGELPAQNTARLRWSAEVLLLIADKLCRQTTDPRWIEEFIAYQEGQA
ncbi:MAG: hypothetical protein KBC46_03255 [Ferrovibrio sp.]|nr:hypothetical protein [Ferrovibrio sp.]